MRNLQRLLNIVAIKEKCNEQDKSVNVAIDAPVSDDLDFVNIHNSNRCFYFRKLSRKPCVDAVDNLYDNQEYYNNINELNIYT